jgi:hypothetical protein
VNTNNTSCLRSASESTTAGAGPQQNATGRAWLLTFAILLLSAVPVLASSENADHGAGIRVQGPGVQPQLFFACCDQGLSALQSLFADSSLLSALNDLHAGLSVAVPDFSPERAKVVRQLNDAGVPVIAWLQLEGEKGPYFDADDAPLAADAFAGFEKWTARYGLRWAAVGLDIEPNFRELAKLKGHEWRLAHLLLSRYFQLDNVYRARAAYAALIRQIQLRGYPVQTYQLPLIVVERRTHSTLIERLLRIVDVRGNKEVVMLYSSFAPTNLGAGIIWAFGRNVQAIAIGSTEGDPKASIAARPLDWAEFSRELIVASHFSHTVGVYNLEGCVRQGFLARLRTMDWSQSVLVPVESIKNAEMRERGALVVLWITSLLPWVAAILLLAIAYAAWRWRRKREVEGGAG